ncbi:MAG: hotdog fold thioesterase [Rhodobacterales bacterium]|nr:hotdog fold thioesterase [Rhodobacterales bacterium]
MYRAAPVNRYFAPELEVGDAVATVRIDVRPDFHHSAGAMHGVVYFKALDDATFFAANSVVQEVFVLTAGFEIEFLRPVRNGAVRAVGTVTADDGHRITAMGELFDAENRLVGRGVGTFARSKMRLGPEVFYS